MTLLPQTSFQKTLFFLDISFKSFGVLYSLYLYFGNDPVWLVALLLDNICRLFVVGYLAWNIFDLRRSVVVGRSEINRHYSNVFVIGTFVLTWLLFVLVGKYNWFSMDEVFPLFMPWT